MDVAKAFQTFIGNLRINNRDDISGKYRNITKILNRNYYTSESETTHCLQVGSFGRGTAINGISDLDMIFSLPWSVHDKFDSRNNNGQSELLQEVKGIIKETYSRTDIRGDGQVVVVQFSNFKFEVVPGFEKSDGSFRYPDSSSGGSWENTDPRPEKDAINKLNDDTNKNLKNLCKMVRAWKNHVGLDMNGLLVDTFCYNFMNNDYSHRSSDYLNYDYIVRDFFDYLSKRNNDQQYWYAPGSNKKVYKKDAFKKKAKKAYENCCEAIKNQDKAKAVDIWKRVFGRPFPTRDQLGESKATERFVFENTEEFIEDMYSVDIRYTLHIDCRLPAKKGGFVEYYLRKMIKQEKPLVPGRDLWFFIKKCRVPEPFEVKWKIKNEGDMAKQKNQIRGQIINDSGKRQQYEYTSFRGPHYVECYVIKDEVCVARDRIPVNIKE